MGDAWGGGLCVCVWGGGRSRKMTRDLKFEDVAIRDQYRKGQLLTWHLLFAE